jgi:hypothetical protein
MVRVRDVVWALAAAAVMLAGSRPTLADPITLTGNIASDFTTSNGSIMIPVDQGPVEIAGTSPTGNNLVGGVDIQNIWLNYNPTTDTMYVGIQGYKNSAGQEEIFGDYSGNPNPAADTSVTTNADGSLNNFGGLKSVALAFAPLTENAAGKNVAGTPSIIAGIPQDKSQGGSGTIDGFTVSQYNGNSLLEMGFGNQIANAGNLAYNPSAAHPDLEFTINNFSKISGINPANGLYLEAYSGTAGSTEGKVQTSWIYSPPSPQGITPEPTTWMAWILLLAGGAGWQYRRRLAGRA